MDPHVLEHDPAWATAFETERAALSEALGALLTTDIEHVGSTSVRGAPGHTHHRHDRGRRVARHRDRVAPRARGSRLAARGYRHHRHRPEAQLFVRVDTGTGLDTHHLHLTVPGSDLWVERLIFRDALRADPQLVGRYAAWKREHATGDAEAAHDAVKTPFVAAVLAARGITVKPDRQRLQP